MMIPFDILFKKYDIKPNGILHIGASSCQEAEIYDMLKIPEVIWIEALPQVFEQGKERLKKYHNQVIIKACISDEDGREVIFHVSNNEAQSSSYLELGHHKIIHPTVHYIEDIPMITTRIDTLFEVLERDISNLDFLNIDLQGAELSALVGMGKLLEQFKFAYLEVNKKETYIGCALIEDIDAYLFGYGFERVETGEWVQDTWTDSLYIKK